MANTEPDLLIQTIPIADNNLSIVKNHENKTILNRILDETPSRKREKSEKKTHLKKIGSSVTKLSLPKINSNSKISAFFTVMKTETINKKTVENSQFFLPFSPKPNVSLAPTDPYDTYRNNHARSHLSFTDSFLPPQIKDLRRKTLLAHPYLVKKKTICYGIDSALPCRNVIKLIQFHTNYRPPYYGTVSYKHKQSPSKLARNPLIKDTSIQYEYDSDEDWGEDANISDAESLSASDCENDEDQCSVESQEFSETEDNDWLVPDVCGGDFGENIDKKPKTEISGSRLSKKKRHIEKSPIILGPFLDAESHGTFHI